MLSELEPPISLDEERSSHATLADLPTEILVKILGEDDEFKTKHSLCRQRLVCRNLNEVAKYRAVQSVVIPRDIKEVKAFLSLGRNTFEQSTKTARIEGHVYPPRNHEWKVLAVCIRNMKGLRTLQWRDETGLDEQVLEAIALLPELESIEWTFLGEPPGDRLRLSEELLSRLKHVTLEFPCFEDTRHKPRRVDVDGRTKSATCYLIANAPRLERLEIGPAQLGLLSLEDIDSEAQRRPGFQPSLCGLVPKAITLLPLSPNSTQFLSQLTSLEIANHFSDADVWLALSRANIKLKIIKVHSPGRSMALIDYLRSYRGLEVFHLGDDVLETPDVGHDFFRWLVTIGLLRHRQSMVDLRFLVTRESTRNHKWMASISFSTTQAIMTCLHRFRRLRRLDFVFIVCMDSGSNRLTIESIFNGLVTLSSAIHTVYLHVLGTGQDSEDEADSLEELFSLLDQFRFGIRPSNWETLRVVLKIYHSGVLDESVPYILNHVALQVTLDDEGKRYRLAMDHGHTLLLSEGSGLHWRRDP